MAEPRRHGGVPPSCLAGVLPPYRLPPMPANENAPPLRRETRWTSAAWLLALLVLAVCVIKLLFISPS